MRDLIDRKKLLHWLAKDMLDLDLKSFSMSQLMEAIPLAIANAKTRADSNPTDENIHLYACYRQLEAVYKKRNDSAGVPSDLIEQAIASFYELENINRQSNSRISGDLPDTNLRSKILMARDWVHKVLPPLEWVEDDMWPLCGFGPGAVVSGGGALKKHILSKLQGEHTITRRAAPIFEEVLKKHFPNWADSTGDRLFSVVAGNKLAFVPKDVAKCRTIAIEPSLNMFLQKGIGEFLTRRLRAFGIDLRDQELNRTRAREGSVTGNLATIDLSDASSRIPRELVKLLLPADWFHLLDSVRSPIGVMPDGSEHRYEMFSSQGNAFTFPLESLLFYALSAAVDGDFSKKSQVSVYGDDIIVPTNSFHGVSDILEWAGGSVNYLKSFHYGRFRESCGGDYINGTFVRPIYYKDSARKYSDVAKLYNLLAERWSWEALPNTLNYLVHLVPSEKRILGPAHVISSEGNELVNRLSRTYDAWFWTPFYHPKVVWNPEHHAFYVHQKYWTTKTLLPKGFIEKFSDDTLRLAFLYGGTRLLESSPFERPTVRRVLIPLAAVR